VEVEVIVDNFAGGGGASTGIELALGRSPDIAVNHDPTAIAMHAANHPETRHLCGDVWDVDPAGVTNGETVDLAWFSPDCKHHSKAKGGKPRDAKIRALAWVVVRWARAVHPRVIILENVEEFQDWGPLLSNHLPDPKRLGSTFRMWLGKLKASGYNVQMRELRACDYGAPTTRKRLFVIARCDGHPIVWPEPTHGPGRSQPWRTAAECIDWSIPCPSIFGRRRPLADNTMRRIARGIQKFVIDNPRPFIVPVKTWGGGGNEPRAIDEPMRTITASKRGEFAVVAPTLVQTGYGERPGQAPRCLDLHQPLGTVVGCGQKHGLVAAFLAKHNGGHEATGSSLDEPIHTVTAKDHHSLVHAFLARYNGGATGQKVDRAIGAITTARRFGLVTVHGEKWSIADIGMRMLQPRELFRAQGFDDAYIIERDANGKRFTKTAQIRCCGNSVCPPLAAALVRANVGAQIKRGAA
jgi:DNA (cytosine-5)-methyltransferase 1